MENKGLLFIPDISGFTRFVNETEIEHSRLIIEELLEILINSNQIGLEVSEIEGDAILFYKFGEPPALEELYQQVQKMFCAFHRNINAYESRRYCQCKACESAISLSLKVVTHYGEFTGYNVKNFSKLIGKDLIVAHQLLKNDIEEHEYWLVTPNLLKGDSPPVVEQWMQWNMSTKHTDTGDIAFHYAQLGELKKQIPNEALYQPDLSRLRQMVSVSREFRTDILSLFHATGDFNYRGNWREGVRKVEEVNHFLPRVGMRCRYVLDNGDEVTYASSYSFHAEKIEFSETDERTGDLTYYTLEKTGEGRSKLTMDFYVERKFLREFIFRLNRKKKMEDNFLKSISNLDELLNDKYIPA